jgi:hypothetical protein
MPQGVLAERNQWQRKSADKTYHQHPIGQCKFTTIAEHTVKPRQVAYSAKLIYIFLDCRKTGGNCEERT